MAVISRDEIFEKVKDVLENALGVAPRRREGRKIGPASRSCAES